MPLIMDDDLDDLFGEAAPLQLPDSVPKGLFQRVDELSLGGCSQYVANLPLCGFMSLKVAKEIDMVQKWLHRIHQSGLS